MTISCASACPRVYFPLHSTASYIHTLRASSSSCNWKKRKKKENLYKYYCDKFKKIKFQNFEKSWSVSGRKH